MKMTIKTSNFLVLCLASGISFSQSWDQKGVSLDGEGLNDLSGWATSINVDGNVVAIGALYNDDGGAESGHVRIYEWNSGTWEQKGADIAGEYSEELSGSSLSLNANGDVVAVGVPYNDDSGEDAGQVRVYAWDGTSWVERGDGMSGESIDDGLGWSVSISGDGNRVAAGAPRNDGTGINSGHIRVYEWSGSEWVQLGSDIDGENAMDGSGYSVALSNDGNSIVTGEIYNDDGASEAGQVRVYEWDGSEWLQKGADLNGTVVEGYFGQSVSLDEFGNTLAIGASNLSAGGLATAGLVQIYEWDGLSWNQMGTDFVGDITEEDLLGIAVDLSNDGSIVAMSAPGSDDFSDDAGKVQVFKWDGTSWSQIGADILGASSAEYFGWSTGLSGDGSTICASAPWFDGLQTGQTRVYTTIEGVDLVTYSSGDLHVYPNPSGGSFYIELPVQNESVTVLVKNLNGQTVFVNDYTNASPILLNLEGISGVYFVELSTPTHFISHARIIIE